MLDQTHKTATTKTTTNSVFFSKKQIRMKVLQIHCACLANKAAKQPFRHL